MQRCDHRYLRQNANEQAIRKPKECEQPQAAHNQLKSCRTLPTIYHQNPGCEKHDWNQDRISINHFVPDVYPPGNRIVGAAVGFGGKLILTVSFRLRLSASSSEPDPITVPRGGRGGFMPPGVAGFGAGCWSSFCIDAQCRLMTNMDIRSYSWAAIGPDYNASSQAATWLFCLPSL
jgi:hypothetical protein